MTLEELISLDRYGHQDTNELSEVQLVEYFTLLHRRQQEVSNLIKKAGVKLPVRVK